MSAATDHLSEQAQEVVQSASSLTEMSAKLRRLVSRWRVPEAEIDSSSDFQRNAA